MARTKAFDENEVLKKAMTLFWEKGYHATSMQDLVDSLGINRASLYDTYGDKSTLYKQAVLLYQDINQETIRSFLFSHKDVRSGLKALFTRTIEQSLSDPDRKGCFIVNTTTEMAHIDAGFTNLVVKNQQAMEQLFAEYIQSGISNQQFPRTLDPQKSASFLYAVNSGIMVLAKISDSREKLEGIVTTALQSLD